MPLAIALGALAGILIGTGLNLAIRWLPGALFPGLTPREFTVTESAAVMVIAVVTTAWISAHFGPGMTALVWLAWLSALIALAGIDLTCFLLPDALTLPLLGLSLAASVPGYSGLSPLDAVLGAGAGYVSLWGLNAAYRRIRQIDGFGGGDMKLMSAIGAWIGPAGVLSVLTISSLLAVACVLGAAGLRRVRPDPRRPIPFGPFLASAAAMVSVWRSFDAIYAVA